MNVVWQYITDFLAPNVGSEKWQLLWTLFNSGTYVLSIFLVTVFLCAWFPKRTVKPRRLGNPDHSGDANDAQAESEPGRFRRVFSSRNMLFFALSLLLHLILPFIYGCKLYRDAASPFNWLIDGPYDFLESYFAIASLMDKPFQAMPGGNVAFRLFWLCATVFVGWQILRLIYGFLRKFISFIQELTTPDEPTPRTRIFRYVVGVITLLVVGIAIGAAIAQEEGIVEPIVLFLQSLRKILNALAEVVMIPENPATAAELMQRFCVNIFSLTMIALYGAGIVFVLYPIIWAAFHPRKFFEVLKDNMGKVARFAGILLVAMMVLSVFYYLFSEYETVAAAIRDIANNGPAAFAGAISTVMLLLAKILVTAILLLAIGTAIYFIYCYLQVWFSEITMAVTKPDSKVHLVMKFLFIALIAGSVFALFFIFYNPISAWITAHFGVAGETYGFKWVLGKVLLIVFSLMAAFFASLLTTGVTLAACWELIKNLDITNDKNLLRRIFNQVWNRFFKLAEIFGFLLDLIKSLAMTILRVFIGYRTESEKNNAIFVAATFASLASLLNTFFGLYEFNHRDDSFVPLVVSISMAFVVQLFMLISGMKAGERMAENIISDSKNVGTSIDRVILKKGFLCAGYVVSLLAVCGAIVSLSRSLFTQGSLLFTLVLIAFSALFFLYEIMVQLQDISVLKQKRSAVKDEPQDDAQAPAESGRGGRKKRYHRHYDTGLFLVNPKRIPARYFFITYLLMMVISTGFAFNNMFGCYADTVNLHNQVFDQVIIKADESVNQRLNDLIDYYNKKNNELLKIVTDKIDEANKLNTKVGDDLEQKSNAEAGKDTWFDRDKFSQYGISTKDFPLVTAYLKSIVAMDYDAIGSDAVITISSYDHYYGTYLSPSYSHKAITITSNGASTDIGTVIDTTAPIDSVVVKGSTVKLPNGAERFADPDSSAQSVTVNTRVIEGADKYDIIKELWILFQDYVVIIENYDGNQSITNDEALSEMLQDLELMDNIRLSLAALCLGNEDNKQGAVLTVEPTEPVNAEDSTDEEPEVIETPAPTQSTSAQVNMLDLPRIVNDYLRRYQKEHTVLPGQPTDSTIPSGEPEMDFNSDGNEQKRYSEKEAALAELDAYIDGTLNVCTILDTASMIDELIPGDDDGDGKQADYATSEDIREFRNYATSITNSNFQLSYDALMKGALGLNPVKGTIDALYSSWIIALFLLLICALVDLMAFFCGLLLFKDAFLLDMTKNQKLSALGYTNYDALLNNYFTPREQQNSDRRHQLAVLYLLMYSDSPASDEILFQKLDVEKSIVEKMIARAREFLEDYGLFVFYDETIPADPVNGTPEKVVQKFRSTAEFHAWLKSFIFKSDINFEEIQKTSRNTPVAP